MYYVGVDLHKKSISVCVVRPEGRRRIVVVRRRFPCSDQEGIYRFFPQYVPFQVVVEATASYEWFVGLVERGGRSGRAGASQEAAGDCRKHAQDGQDRRPNPGRVFGVGHDPRGVSAHAASASVSDAGPVSALRAEADGVGAQQGPPHPGPTTTPTARSCSPDAGWRTWRSCGCRRRTALCCVSFWRSGNSTSSG